MTSRSPEPDAAPEPVRHRARQAVLAVTVLEGLDLLPTADGVVVPGPSDTLIDWADIDSCVQAAARDEDAHRLVSALIRLQVVVTDLGSHAMDTLSPSLRLLALPRDHVVHPGASWVRDTVLGGTLDLGIGIIDVVGRRTDCVPLPAVVAKRLRAEEVWAAVRHHAEEMAQICASRLRREGVTPQTLSAMRSRVPRGVLRPVGGVDVPSLMSTTTLRQELVDTDPSGMRAVAAPMRNRGWYDLSLTDPAFVGSAWVATDPVMRGLRGPILVTAEEVAVRDHHIDLTLLEERTGPALASVDSSTDPDALG